MKKISKIRIFVSETIAETETTYNLNGSLLKVEFDPVKVLRF